jgi:predicted  nucleic acid-binding Zn-ribbon protein
MRSDLENLLALQDVDREIARLSEEVAALPLRVAAIEAQLAATQVRLEQARLAVKADDAARKKHDAAIIDLQQRISKYRDQSLDVKTNDQYRALMHEIEFAQHEIRGNEDKLIELMEKAEAREKDVKAAEAELKAETAEIEKEKEVAREKTAEDEKLLAEWNAKRDQVRSGVAEDLLQHYERVAKFRKTGIAEVRDGKCTTCQVKLRPQVFAEVRAGEKLMICESCQRILYYTPPPPSTAEAETKKRRAKPKADAGQAWFYRADYGTHGEALLLFLNGGENSIRRIFDLHTGRVVQEQETRAGAYSAAFAEDLAGALRLNGFWPEEELTEYGNELPMIVLDVLHRDLSLALAEAGAAHKETVAS